MAGGATQELKERVAKLEALLGMPSEGPSSSICERLDGVIRDVQTLQSSWEERSAPVLQRLEDRAEEHATLAAHRMEGILEEIESFKEIVQAELIVLKKAFSGLPSEEEAPSKLKVPDPLHFNGTRCSKELENFLWDMEQYFHAARIKEVEKVTVAAMYLTGDAKLWWRTRLTDDLNAGRPKISTWESLTKELRDQFLPGNTSWVAREAMRSLKHDGSVREYVTQFSSLMLDVKDMSEADKLFNFMSGLQGWACLELRRQGVLDLPSAMAAAESLMDFRQPKPSAEEVRKPKFKGKGKRSASEEGPENRAREARDYGKEKVSMGEKPPRSKGCFICDGPHRARDCPKKEKLNAIRGEEVPEEDDLAPIARVNPLQLRLNAMRAEKPTELMYLPLRIKAVETTAMLDTGATHNVMSVRKAAELGLKVSKSSSEIKLVNAESQPIEGRASKVPVEVGKWKGKMDFFVLPMDDFDVILGVDFFLKAKAMAAPFVGGLFFMDEEQPDFVHVTGVQAQSGGGKGGDHSKKASTRASSSSSGGGLSA